MELPTKEEIEKIITEFYKYNYGTNYDDDSLKKSIFGAEIIIRNLMDKKDE